MKIKKKAPFHSHKKKKKTLFLLFSYIIFLLQEPLLASENLLLRAKSASKIEFQAFLRTDHPFISFEEFYIKKRPLIKRSHDLEKLLKEAQKTFLSGNFEQAENNFQKLKAMKFLEDWSYEQRKTFHYSLLRLFQISKNEVRQKTLIKEAQNFAPFMKIDTKLFPPFLIKKIKNLKPKENFISWFPSKKFQNSSSFLINGKVYQRPLIQPLLLPSKENFRLTLLSNTSYPTSKIINQEKLHMWNLKEKVFITGHCKSFKISSPLLIKKLEAFKKNIFVFFKSNCIKSLKRLSYLTFKSPSHLKNSTYSNNFKNLKDQLPYNDDTKKWKKRALKNSSYEKEIKTEPLNLDAHFKKEHQSLFISENNQRKNLQDFFINRHKLKKEKLKRSQSSLLKSKWFWMGVSAFVTTSISITLYSLNKKSVSYTKPSKKRGF